MDDGRRDNSENNVSPWAGISVRGKGGRERSESDYRIMESLRYLSLSREKWTRFEISACIARRPISKTNVAKRCLGNNGITIA